MKNKLLLLSAALLCLLPKASANIKINTDLAIMTAGNPVETYKLNRSHGDNLTSGKNLPVTLTQTITENGDRTVIDVTIEAKSDIYFNISQHFLPENINHDECEFYMPGFWYHRNMRSPKEAPSCHTSDSWQVREDRLSSPLSVIYHTTSGKFCSVMRMDKGSEECIAQNLSGDITLSGKTSVGSVGFDNLKGKTSLVFSFPYIEAPKRYIRKLTLIDPVRAFEHIKAGERRTIKWEIRQGTAKDYSALVDNVWNYCFNTLSPKPVDSGYDRNGAMDALSRYFDQSFVDEYELKYFSGCAMRCDDSKNAPVAEIGFVGRTLLNAYNAIEYGEKNNRQEMVTNARAIFESYLNHSFTPQGFFREAIDYGNQWEEKDFSIRRQSEGVFAVLFFLDYEKKHGRKHPEWEKKIRITLDNFLNLQSTDGSIPRKFNDAMEVKDASGGSTPSATLPLVMAYKYFKDKKYLDAAKKTALYLETELVNKADYFSSTLDANCEDKEASLYASTAFYYLTFATKGKERAHYVDLCQKSAYFCLSWYYMWDVPFAPGQMLGDLGFKSRGWGNVSVENNHIDVFIFEFASILEWLATERNKPEFAQFAHVIQSSMLQLMPVKGHMVGIGKEGYYPEVVQHTTWDYGKNGKGFYNDIFAPGWTVASLWQMLNPTRVPAFFK